MKYPFSKAEPVTDKLHGVQVTDDYRWLEADDSPELDTWIGEQNKFVDAHIDAQKLEYYRRHLAKYRDIDSVGIPSRYGDMYFWSETTSKDQKPKLYTGGEPYTSDKRLLLDMNLRPTDSLDYWYPSPDGSIVAYGISANGDELATMYFMDTTNGATLKEYIPFARYSQIAWQKDSRSLYYTKTLGIKGEESMHAKLFYHVMGDDPATDTMILGEDLPKDIFVNIDLNQSYTRLYISLATKWTQNDIIVYDIRSGTFSDVVRGIEASFSFIACYGNLYLLTDYKADNNRILTIPESSIGLAIDKWEELVPEPKDAVLTGFRPLQSRQLLLFYRQNSYSRADLLHIDTKKIVRVQLPKFVSISASSSSVYAPDCFISYVGYTKPRAVGSLNCSDASLRTIWEQTSLPGDEQLQTQQFWSTSADGTRVPYSLISRKDISTNRPSPTIIYVYGGFSSGLEPNYITNWRQWVLDGGVYIEGNIRGGDECGKNWHQLAIKANKQKSFEDLKAIAEDVIKNGYTSSEMLGATGGSNGGMVVSATAILYPDLFKAIASIVPLCDMFRFPKFLIASRWVHEYGDPSVKDEFKVISTWSPYHNVKLGVDYPSFYFYTADHDTRVHPLHARKMTALLQNSDTSNIVMLRTSMGSGHTASNMTKEQQIKESAEKVAFFAQELGLNIP